MGKTLITLCLVIVIAVSGVVIAMNLPPSHPAVATVPFTTLAQGSLSKVTAPGNYIIRTQSDLAELWQFLEEPPPAPTIDFNTKVVAAVFAGDVPTPGYAVAVAAVEDGGERIVEIDFAKPAPTCVLAHATTSPYQVVELPKTSLPFTHNYILTTSPCS